MPDLSSYTNALDRYIQKLSSRNAPNAVLFQGETPIEAVRSASAASAGLGNVDNVPPDGGAVGGYLMGTPKGVKESLILVNREAHLNVKLDEIMLGFADNVVTSGELVYPTAVITDPNDLAEAKAAEVSWGRIYAEWLVFSRGGPTYTNNYLPAERNSFTYDQATDVITSTVDSQSTLGFITPRQYDDYIFDVTCTSTSGWQNDPIGIVIGYNVDAQGNAHTLSYMPDRRFNDIRANCLVLDYGSTTTVRNISGNTTGIKTMWGTLVADNTAHPVGKSVWNANPWVDNPNGYRLRVSKVGSVLTVESTNYNETTFVDAATFTFDLASDGGTALFAGPTQLGFTCQSQDFVVWTANEAPFLRNDVVDLYANEKHTYDQAAGAWVIVPFNDDDLTSNQFHRNVRTGETFFKGIGGLTKL